MYELSDAGHAAWRQLEQEWQAVQERWHDSSTEYFAGNLWEPLATDVQAYLQAVDSLEAVLAEIEELTAYY